MYAGWMSWGVMTKTERALCAAERREAGLWPMHAQNRYDSAVCRDTGSQDTQDMKITQRCNETILEGRPSSPCARAAG